MSISKDMHNDPNIQNERSARSFYANGRYLPLFLGVTGIGFLAIYWLTRTEILGNASPQLVAIGVLVLSLALVEIPLLGLARRNKGILANILGSIAIGIFAAALVYLWQGVLVVAVSLSLISPILAIRSGIPRRYHVFMGLIAVVSLALVFYAERASTYPRLPSNTPAAIASLAFLTATTLLLFTISGISQNTRFKSLQTLLLTSFILIVTIPTVMSAALATVGAFKNSEEQTFGTLKAITSLKRDQIAGLISDSQTDAKKLTDNLRFSSNALTVLNANNADPASVSNAKRLVRLAVENSLGGEEEAYNEIMVLNTQGDVVVSTDTAREGTNFQDQLFFRQGTLKSYVGFAKVPSFGTANLVVASPIFDEQGRVIRGVLVMRSSADSIKEIMENTRGFEEAETYLVDKNFHPLTKTRSPIDVVRTQASLDAVLKSVESGQGIYNSYEEQSVLGYYEWFEPMQVSIIAEMPRDFVIANSLNALVGSASLAIFVIIIAVAAVSISARSIVEPIGALAETTANIAAGKLSARANIERNDEIGKLASAYNQMASQLQEIIGKLEQRVADRTSDLENQTNRLRVTAEISRDLASFRSLSDLLERSAKLILDRFGFDHIGIYLHDNSREYAVLVASPTDAGKQMMANAHQLRVGEATIVGRVAATGESRVSKNVSGDANYFNNPLLPDTRSEMALPLRAENTVIGVLDIQSNTENAFTEDDVAITQILADQLAAAIERTRLLQEVERSLQELETAYGQYTRNNWRSVAENTLKGKIGYRFDNIRIESMSEVPEIGKNAIEKGMTIAATPDEQSDHQHYVAVPIKLRGHSIGVITLKLKEGYADETVSTVEQASDRLASAFESARLYEEARLRADREQTISQLTNAISASNSYEDILQTTVREIGNVLRDTEVSIQILNEPTHTRQFMFDGKQVIAVDNSPKRDQIKHAVKTGSLVLDKDSTSSSVSVPIKLRGQTIGVIDTRSKRSTRDWTNEEITLLEAAAERAALALENARLLENAQRRASRERMIGEISSRIGSASDFNSILRATVEEMGRRLGATEVIFELETNTDKDGGEN